MKQTLRLLSLAFLAPALALVALSTAQTIASRGTSDSYDLVITNARIVDGSGNPWFRGDVAIKNGRIVRVGRINSAISNHTIDAGQKILAPGFIDVHTHVESIFNLPEAENFVRMGVTSLVTGNCGSSSTDVAQFLRQTQDRPLAVNLATLVAHGSVRRKVIGLADRAPNADELRQMERITLGLVRDARSRGLMVTVDQYAYTASSTSLDSRLPGWLRADGAEEGRKRLADPATRDRVMVEMKGGLKRNGFKDYSYAVVASYQSDKSFNGKSIAEITKLVRRKKDVKSQIEQIIAMYEAGGASMVYHGMSEDDIQRIMREPFTMIASDSGVRRPDESVPHPRGYGNNARVLGHYVRELKLISLEDAIRKMSSLPAQTFGFRDRGMVREGFAADLVLFDDQIISDRATFTTPHQFPDGIHLVVVNGSVVLEQDQMTTSRPGIALRGPGYAGTL
ncbi:MAG TPA: amidohydrolase family protein [Pyrinomonadaceae bacterium]|nr:amidohydrolase family protein [Pyrinomonadaceae bacterium]